MRLSPHQFHGLAGQLQPPDGGFSVHMSTGEEPDSGYMVAQAGTERSFPKEHGDVKPQELQGYTAEHAQTLQKRDTYFGGWHDPVSGSRDLDISHHYGQNFTRATAAMQAGDQKSMYDLNRWRSVRNTSKEGAPSLGIHPDSPEDQASMKKASQEYLAGTPAEPPEFLKGR